MKYLLLIGLLLPLWAAAQNYPSDAKVIEEVKKYHGKLATAKVQNEWKQEKEAGYTFNNMAKRVVTATTVKEGNISRNLTGLAIYTRGSAQEAWQFSRYFVTSGEVVGAKSLTATEMREQLIALLQNDPTKVLVDYSDVAWVYDITFPEEVNFTTDRSGDRIYTATIEYEYKFIASIPFEGGLRRYKNPLEVYVRLIDGAYRVATAVVVNKDPINTTLMTEKQYNELPVMGQKPFNELFGPQGPAIPEAPAAEKIGKNIKLPKVKGVLKG